MIKMKNRIFRAFGIFALLPLFLLSCQLNRVESNTLTHFAKSDENSFRTLYFYPTTIRMLSRVIGDDTGMALSEVRRGRAFFTFSDNEGAINVNFKTLQTGVEEEGFENLMRLKSQGSTVAAYIKGEEPTDYVVFISGADGNLILELVGELSPATLRDISKLDLSKAAGMFDLLPEAGTPGSDTLNLQPEPPEDIE